VAWSPSSPSGCTEGLAWAEQPSVGSTIGSGVTCVKGGVDCTKGGGGDARRGKRWGVQTEKGCVVQKEEEWTA